VTDRDDRPPLLRVADSELERVVPLAALLTRETHGLAGIIVVGVVGGVATHYLDSASSGFEAFADGGRLEDPRMFTRVSTLRRTLARARAPRFYDVLTMAADAELVAALWTHPDAAQALGRENARYMDLRAQFPGCPRR